MWVWGGSSSPGFKRWRKKICSSGKAVQSLMSFPRMQDLLTGLHPVHVLLLCCGETGLGISPYHSLISLGTNSPEGAVLSSSLALHLCNRRSRTSGISAIISPQPSLEGNLPGKEVVCKHSPGEPGKAPLWARMDSEESFMPE